MMLLTHLMFSFLLGLAVLKFIGLNANPFLFFLILIFSAIIPDIDCRHSFIGKKFKAISLFFKHRGFFHGILLMIILAVIVFLVSNNKTYSYAVILGFLSHLLLDSNTPSGISPFWPSKLRLKGKIKTGSVSDWVFLVVFLVLIVGLFLV